MLEKIEKSIFLTKPIIGIVGRRVDNYYKINKNIINAVTLSGGIPIMILDMDLISYLDGIILPGGTDVTILDKDIVRYAIKKDIPILGICLGMQVMASIDNDNLGKIKNHNKTNLFVHKIKTKKDSILGSVIGDVYVNSRHNEYVKDSGIYEVTARSNVIEGIEYSKNRFNVGVQWHPEDLIYDDEKELNLFKLFVESCKKKSI